MVVKTKKYELPQKIYRKLALRNVWKKQWWIPLAIALGIFGIGLSLYVPFGTTWVFYLVPLGPLGFNAFWWIQFYGATQMEQGKMMFEKMAYEIDSRYLMAKLNIKDERGRQQAMRIEWDMVKGVEKRKDAYVLFISKGQFIYLPFKIFKSSNDIQFTESIFRRKGLLPAVNQDS